MEIPAPACEVVALVATARTSFPSVVLHGELDSESRCLASFLLLSYPSYNPPSPPPFTYQRCQPLPLSALMSSASLLSAVTPIGEQQIGLATEIQPNIIQGGFQSAVIVLQGLSRMLGLSYGTLLYACIFLLLNRTFLIMLRFFGSRFLRNQMADKRNEADKNIELWRIKKLIKDLEAARGNGTSMISLIIPPRDQISRVTKMLADEFGTASNIKKRVNRLSVLGAITSARQRLKLYHKVPPNGLVLYTGTIVTEEGKEKKVTIDFEPFRPINASLYLCDNKFHLEVLHELLECDEKYGFIIMDGNGTLLGTLSGNTREILHRFTVDLPKKHGRGGQSALRFARLRTEKCHNYVRKTAELATQFFINPATNQPNVAGLILAGSADFKTELSQSNMFDPRLQAKILKVVDVSSGGESGFNQAIELSAEVMSNVKFIQEKRLIGKYLEEIGQDTGKYVFGVDDTLKALEMGAIETLIVWEFLDMNRYVLKHSTTGEIVKKYLNKEQEVNQENFAQYEVQEKMSLVDWFADEYKQFGCTLEFVTNKSQEGSQFCRGFGGIGGILRYKLDMRSFDDFSEDGEEIEKEIPAPACEVVAHVVTARTSFPSVMLHENFDSESRPPQFTHWQCQQLPLSAITSSASSLSTVTPKGEQQIGLATETHPNVIKGCIALAKEKLSHLRNLPRGYVGGSSDCPPRS
ncbi:Eukaryotic peptide chain release factor subunit 1-3 [Senna tora]|uniref:Eukaryotic peptide chain release factor subunit 1-3 n=1 Tax=Senna tora TaxID=362788 RepID=A0A834T0A8_9FABA|nr:Eukaryotic peptide chain release factor subunit 1-3 [Senna tora]